MLKIPSKQLRKRAMRIHHASRASALSEMRQAMRLKARDGPRLECLLTMSLRDAPRLRRVYFSGSPAPSGSWSCFKAAARRKPRPVFTEKAGRG